MGNFDDEIKNKFSHLKEGEVLLVENIRFFLKKKQIMMKIFQKN